MERFAKLIFLTVLGLFFSSLASANTENETRFNTLLHSSDKAQAIEQALEIIENVTLTPIEHVHGHSTLAKLHNSNSQPKRALNNAHRALALSQQYGLREQEARASKLVGILYFFKNDVLNAMQHYQLSLDYFRETNQKIEQAHVLNNMALATTAVHDFESAVKQFEEAAEIYSNVGSALDSIDVQQNIAILYNRLQQYETAISIFSSVIKKLKTMERPERLARAYLEYGRSFQGAGQFETALEFINRAYVALKAQDNEFQVAFAANSLANVYLDLNKIEKSERHAKESIALGEKTDNTDAVSGAYYALAKVNYYRANHDAAVKFIEKSQQLAIESTNPERQMHNSALYALILASKGETHNAVNTLRNSLAKYNENGREQATAKMTIYRAKSNADRLMAQVNDLMQKEKLQSFEFEQAQQRYQLWLSGSILLIVISFFFYRSRSQAKLKRNLSQKVKLRTEELELLMEEVQQANATKNQFLANMSHELRTPLTAVIGQAEAIIAGDVEPEFVHKEVEIIYSNSTHLLTLLNDLLDLSRIEANKLELELKQHDIHKVIDKVSSFFQEQAQKKGLDFVVDNRLSSPFVMMIDELRLKQILINLCSNAIKFTYRGRVTMIISADTHCVSFKVIDTGIGLNEEQLAQIFNRFTQGDSSISRRFGGSGLGLCLSQQLAIMMNGNIDVASEINIGSEFIFSLPISEQPCYVQQELPAVTQRLDPNLTLNGLVLLADDHDDNRRLTERLLRVLGLNVVTAANGYQAIKQYNLRKPDLVLLDIQMPEMDGIEAFKALRQQGAKVPIVALTANAMNHEIEHYIRLGFDDYVSKPIVRNYFVQVLARNLRQTVVPEQTQQLAQVDTSDISKDFKASFKSERKNFALLLSTFDYSELAKAAHRFSGAAAVFQFSQLATLGADIEKAIKQQQHLKAKTLTEQLIALLSEDDIE